MGPRDQDPKHLNLFFPESDDTLKDPGWDAVLRWGYLKSFFAQKRRMPRDDFIDLRQDLGRIFNRLQCLPVAGVPKGCYKGSIWMEGKKGGEKRISDIPKSLLSEEDSCGKGHWPIQEEERP